MICQCCKQPFDRLKTNTHYLTDGVIRTCLNLDGSNERATGFYFDISNDKPFMDFNFQQSTSVVKLEEALGRAPTEEEIQKAMTIPYSVDDTFCDQCEKDFEKIEGPFLQTILPQFRESDLTGKTELSFDEVWLCRLFFYLQIWRSSLCEPILKLAPDTQEKLRLILLTPANFKASDINDFPLSVLYLETKGDPKEYTKNLVGFSNDQNPYVIFFNDFVIQFFDNKESIRYTDLFGLIKEEAFWASVNHQEDRFKITILEDALRLKFIQTYGIQEKVDRSLQMLNDFFVDAWRKFFFVPPPLQIIDQYKAGLLGNKKEGILQFSPKAITDYTAQFLHAFLIRRFGTVT